MVEDPPKTKKVPPKYHPSTFFFTLGTIPPDVDFSEDERTALHALESRLGTSFHIKVSLAPSEMDPQKLDKALYDLLIFKWEQTDYNGVSVSQTLIKYYPDKPYTRDRCRAILIGGHISHLVVVRENKGGDISPLSSLSAEFAHFSHLMYLRLENLEISSFSPAFLQQNFPSLRYFNLCENLIETLPEGFTPAHFPALQEINLVRNQFFDFPEILFQIPSLEKLSLCSNHIELLPESVCTCSPTLVIFLEGNPLRSLSGLTQFDFDYTNGSPKFNLSPRGFVLILLPSLYAYFKYKCFNDFSEPRESFFLDDVQPHQVRSLIQEISDMDRREKLPHVPQTYTDRNYNRPGLFVPWLYQEFDYVFRHITQFPEDAWCTYYATHPAELARRYLHTVHNSSSPPLDPELIQRLEHEADHRILAFLRTHLPSDDPVVATIQQRFTVPLNSSPSEPHRQLLL